MTASGWWLLQCCQHRSAEYSEGTLARREKASGDNISYLALQELFLWDWDHKEKLCWLIVCLGHYIKN